MNVFLGLNATGKTTLLELIAAALSFNFSKFKAEAFFVEYELAFSTGTIQVSMRNERVERPPLETPMGQISDAEMFALAARLEIRFSDPPKAWTVCADESSIWIENQPGKLPLQTHLAERGPGMLFRAMQIDFNKPLVEAYKTELWAWDRARRFDEALDLFRDVTSSSTWVEAAVDRTAKVVQGYNFAGFVPRELIGAVGEYALRMSADSQGLTIPSESLRFLHDVATLFGFSAARLEMRRESQAGGRAHEALKFSEFRFMFEAPDGSLVPHENLSYGQKRLLAFYYYLAASPRIVVADELVDGLHHLWIDAAVDAIGDRQAFLASQNPLLLDHLEFDSAERVACTFIICRSERSGNKKRMIWSNLSDYDADRFFRAYQVDVQHVSEILLSKGLW
jgi:energy-coupling factor transporter ATP-binding protein EcfA2